MPHLRHPLSNPRKVWGTVLVIGGLLMVLFFLFGFVNVATWVVLTGAGIGFLSELMGAYLLISTRNRRLRKMALRHIALLVLLVFVLGIYIFYS